MSSVRRGVVKAIKDCNPGPYETLDPFLFCVFHKDQFPAGDGKMQVPNGVKGSGADFNPSAPYRMYHGDRIPGFPQHPHRGFETITATLDGIIDHTDSAGNAGRYGHGDLQWMTAGRGIVHGEMFPLINTDKPNPTKFYQIWMNLPAKNKMVPPDFVMHWAEDVKRHEAKSTNAHVTVWAGQFFGQTPDAPPTNSWAADPNNDVGILHIKLSAGGSLEVPPCTYGNAINRRFYIVEGKSLTVEGRTVPRAQSPGMATSVTVSGDGAVTLEATEGGAEVLMLQGRPIKEPVAQHGPFVMNTRQEIAQAFADYQATQFGGWPWPKDAMAFPANKGRFALVNGTELRPPSSSA